ncbi:type I-E CRISPR-associated protein Cas6/Cse3/CasE [Streptomyces sp. NPDC004111]|uniref:type I-E CRISPR-associated protein Cas6/Cse3/CasE n=1 Tax=Streptomyces sp. NPDC004111 TaxID=3364690 RepID=UPI0036C3ADA3
MHTATLTRIHLNLNNRTVRRDLADYPTLHRTVMLLAPDGLGPCPRQEAGLLFRLEPESDPPVLLIQSTQPPDLSRLPPLYGTTAMHSLEHLFAGLHPGRRVCYRITASPLRWAHHPPTQDPTTAPPRRSTPVLLAGDDALAWWHRRATAAGLALESSSMSPRPFRRASARPGPWYRLTQFDGTARIAEPEILAQALCAGIGKAKSYGAGLLTLAPA